MKRFKKVYLEISNICNLSCSFCPGTVRGKRMLSREEFGELTDKLSGYTDYLYFHLMGEPLLHPELESFLKTAGKKGFKVIITTNGTLLKKCGQILTSSDSLHKVNISLQSFEANYDGSPEAYISMCAEFASEMEKCGKLCILRLWNKNGLESMNSEIESVISRYFPKPWELSRGSYRLGNRIWLESGEKFDWPELGRGEESTELFCMGLRDQIGVLCDGTVVPCCLDHNGDIALGNLFDSDLAGILGSKRACDIYNGFSRRTPVEPLCKSCGYAKRFSL